MFKYLVIFALTFSVITHKSFADTPTEQFQDFLQEHQGNVIYVDFWASWCGPCRKSFPWMNEMQAKYENLKIVSINLDDKKRHATKFLKKTPANFAIIYDSKGTLAKKYKVQGMPTSYIYNKKGELVNAHIGFSVSQVEEYELELKKYLEE